LRFEWDQDGADTVVRHGGGDSDGVILWRERTGPTGQDASKRFAEIAEVLHYKYGENLKDLAPTPAGLRALRGDGPLAEQEEAAARVAAARAALGTAPETRRYDRHSLTFSVGNGQRETVRRFLAQGGDPNTAEYGTLLQVAAERRQAAIVRMLLCAGADTEFIDSRGYSPLAYALHEPRLSGGIGDDRHAAALAIVRLLVEAGASLDGLGKTPGKQQRGGGQEYMPPLVLAAEHGNVAALRFLLDRGADPGQADHWGMTALHYAAFGGVVETARLLCEAGADPNAAYEPPLWTPLHSAIYSSDARDKGTAAPLIRLLSQSGADIDKGESDGDSPLFAAISEARHDLVVLLLELGANIRHRNAAGEVAAAFLVQRTHLRLLSEEEMLPILQTLLSAGADPRATSKSGQSAYDLAREYDLWDIASLLKAV
jgi:ankyrin repeat protein